MYIACWDIAISIDDYRCHYILRRADIAKERILSPITALRLIMPAVACAMTQPYGYFLPLLLPEDLLHFSSHDGIPPTSAPPISSRRSSTSPSRPETPARRAIFRLSIFCRRDSLSGATNAADCPAAIKTICFQAQHGLGLLVAVTKACHDTGILC